MMVMMEMMDGDDDDGDDDDVFSTCWRSRAARLEAGAGIFGLQADVTRALLCRCGLPDLDVGVIAIVLADSMACPQPAFLHEAGFPPFHVSAGARHPLPVVAAHHRSFLNIASSCFVAAGFLVAAAGFLVEAISDMEVTLPAQLENEAKMAQ